MQAGTAQAAGHWYTTQLRSSDEAQRSLVEGMLLDDAALDRLMASLLREPAGTRMRRKLLCALESPKYDVTMLPASCATRPTRTVDRACPPCTGLLSP